MTTRKYVYGFFPLGVKPKRVISRQHMFQIRKDRNQTVWLSCIASSQSASHPNLDIRVPVGVEVKQKLTDFVPTTTPRSFPAGCIWGHNPCHRRHSLAVKDDSPTYALGVYLAAVCLSECPRASHHMHTGGHIGKKSEWRAVQVLSAGH